jgi:tellurite methyltransferase
MGKIAAMGFGFWEGRYQSRERVEEDFDIRPTPLLAEVAQRLRPGKALDLACGTGRNTLWLAEKGWSVTAVDRSPTAIDVLCQRAKEKGLPVEALVADLELLQYPIRPAHWDLIVISYYLQQNLLEPAKAGSKPGGLVLAIVHITAPGEEPTKTRLGTGELANYFAGWEIVHSYEGEPHDPTHRRSVAEIVARRPG